jgi:N-acetyl-anhydromuramyl-L-alanine amidase AmpD
VAQRFWPLDEGRKITSPFGPREGGFHYGVDFGRDGGSGGMPVYAIQSGTVIHAGAAQGYGGPDPCGWLVIDSSDSEGSGCLEYGHIRRLPNINVGTRVTAGQQIAVINPDPKTNGGTAPHLHLSDMPGAYNPAAKQNPLIRLVSGGAMEPSPNQAKKKKENPLPLNTSRPDFNEYPLWSPNNEPRNGTKIDLFLLHTEEGGGVKDGADRLARWMQNPSVGVSYHYTVSQDPTDNGVTVVNVTDTDRAAWSALSANRRSINLVFAGSKAGWTRDQWLLQSRAIDVAAYLAAQDCAKYGIAKRVLKPPYSAPGGVSDHRYVTKYLRDGTHGDVGGPMSAPWTGFPWDVFEDAFLRHAGITAPVTPPVTPPAATPKPVGTVEDQLTLRWNCLGGQTVVEALAEMRDKVLGTNDRNKDGVK